MKNKNYGCGTLILALFGFGLIYYIVDYIANNKTLLIITIVVAVLLFAVLLWAIFNKQKTIASLTEIDAMKGMDFENYTAILLRSLGFKNVTVTQTSNDYGVDVLAEKDGARYAVQCKRYSHKVNNSAIQEVVAGMRCYNCSRAIVITNNYFTKNAIQLANVNGVELWDRDYLAALTSQYGKNKNRINENTNNIKKDTDEIKISAISNMPYLFDYNDKSYNIEIISDIENMPTDLGFFNWNNYRYRVDEYIELCADIYSKKGHTDISEALKRYVRRFRQDNYLNDKGEVEFPPYNYSQKEPPKSSKHNKKIDEIIDDAIKKATEENEIKRNKTYDNYKWFDYNELIDNQIAFGALINSVPEEVKNELFSSGALIPTKEPLYPEFSFSEEEWEQCGKDYETLCAFLKKKNVWYNKSLQELDRYTESDFIKYVKDLLIGLHYENIVDTNSDMGVDITCSKDDINYAIKCQHSISQRVSVKPIRNIAAGKNYYQCQVGIVISNNYFSTSAIDMANANAIILWDRDKLQSIMYGKV